jgi:hypothetical protein
MRRNSRPQVIAVYAVTVALLMGVSTVTGASEAASPDRLVRRFLREGHHLRDADAMRRTIEWFDRYLR